jgi:hypothetical protein
MENLTLEDFIKNYINNLQIQNTRESYEDFVKRQGIDSSGILNRGISEAEGDYVRASTGYGRLAEGLSGMGLSGSGYSDYLGSMAYSALQKTKEGLLFDYAENERRNVKNYESYLSEIAKQNKSEIKDYVGFLVSLDKKTTQSFADVVKTINSQNITNYEAAYKVATEAGLTGEVAENAANIGCALATEAKYKTVIDKIISHNFSESEAYYYARSMGYSESEARIIAGHAKNINSTIYQGSLSGIFDDSKK